MTDVEMADRELTDAEMKDRVVDLLEGFTWQWLATLNFRPRFTEEQAKSRLREWCDQLRETLGTEDFEFVVVPKYGRRGNHFQFHLLITGLRPGCGDDERLEWVRRWSELSGYARISDFKPGIGGVRYILRYIDADDLNTVEMHFCARTRKFRRQMPRTE
jgi:hypothetical protein